jgi:hypothetical protein
MKPNESSRMTVKGQTRQTTRNGLVVAALLAVLGGVAWLGGSANGVPRGVALGLATAGVALGLLVMAGMIWPACNLVLWRLSRYGPPHQVAADIDGELAQEETVRTFGRPLRSFRISNTGKFPIVVTPSWLLQFGELGLRAARLNDITWFYKKILTQSYSFGVKDRWYSVVVHERNGRVAEFTQVEAEVEKLVEFLHLLLPGVACGFPQNLTGAP